MPGNRKAAILRRHLVERSRSRSCAMNCLHPGPSQPVHHELGDPRVDDLGGHQIILQGAEKYAEA